MNCHEYEADLVDLARGDGTVGRDRPDLRGHLEGCADCAARFDRERKLTAGFRALAREVEVIDANPAAELRLIEMFTSRSAAQTGVGGLVRGRSAGLTWALAAAAGLALVVGAAWTAARWQRPDEGAAAARAAARGSRGAAPSAVEVGRRPGDAATRADARPVGSSEPAWPPVARSNASGAGPAPARSRPAARRAGRQPVVEELAGFVALPAADRLPVFESGMIVRVELPVSSLPVYGLQIVPDAARTPVTADVLVGQDGQPRAVRLVRMETGPRRIR